MGVTPFDILAPKVVESYFHGLDSMHSGVRDLLGKYEQLVPTMEKWINSRIGGAATEAVRNAVLHHKGVVTFEIDLTILAKEAWEKSPPNLKKVLKPTQLTQMMVLLAIDAGWPIEDNKIKAELHPYQDDPGAMETATPEIPPEPEEEAPLMLAEPE
jgi:hypothetical protein